MLWDGAGRAMGREAGVGSNEELEGRGMGGRGPSGGGGGACGRFDLPGAEPGVGTAHEVAQVGERIASSASSRRIMKCRFASGT